MIKIKLYGKMIFKEDFQTGEIIKEKRTIYYDILPKNSKTLLIRADLYDVMFEPKNLNIIVAKDAIPYLKKGLKELLTKEKYYKSFNNLKNKGKYEDIVDFIINLMEECKSFPEAYYEVDL